jgi:hypothetical protein
MNLEKLNPGLFATWKLIKDAPPEFYTPPDPEAVKELERIAGGRIPEDYKEFLLTYSKVSGSVRNGVMYFKCKYPTKEVIRSDFGLISSARHTIDSTNILSKPHPTLDGVGARIPHDMLATNIDNYRTFLIDLRPESFGKIFYIAQIKKQTFGTAGYNWDDVAFVGDSFAEFLVGIGTKEELKAKYPKLKIL